MSTIKVDAIRSNSASSDAITLDSNGKCAVTGTTITGTTVTADTGKFSNLPNRNLIINGAMKVQQRAAGNYTTVQNGYMGIDRFHVWASNASKLTYEPSTDSPTGFSSSFKITSTSAFTPSSGAYFYIGQKIEGHNWEQLEYGTSNAKTITISFWVKSSITGTWSGIVKNNAQDRTFPWEYTISSADTWEKKTITVAGCPDGTWLTGTGAGAWIYFCIGNHSTSYLGSANSWQSQNLIGTTGSNSLVNTNGATWYMTGLKVEEGSTATDFEHTLFGDELLKCQRYYFRETATYYAGLGYGTNASSNCLGVLQQPCVMRATPSVVLGTASYWSGSVSGGGQSASYSFVYGQPTQAAGPRLAGYELSSEL